MDSLGVTALVVIFALVPVQDAEGSPGCNCTKLHPQQHYCSANYVIRGKVLLLRWELNPEIETEPSTVTDAVTNPVMGTTTRPSSTEVEASRPNVTRSEADGATTTLPSATGQKQETQNSTEGSLAPSPKLTIPDAMPAHRRDRHLRKNPMVMQEPWNYQIIYTVVIQDAFKMADGQSAAGEVELISPYPGAGFCGVELKAGRSYILAGKQEGVITGCDWVQENRQLTKLQKRGLKNNYKQSCETCQVKTCPYPECTGELSPRTCAYYLPPSDEHNRFPIGYPSTDCTARYQLCQPRGRAAKKCSWTTSKDSRTCSKRKDGRNNA